MNNALVDYACVLSAYFREAEAGKEIISEFVSEVPECYREHFKQVRRRMYRAREMVKALRRGFGVRYGRYCEMPCELFQLAMEFNGRQKIRARFHNFYICFYLNDFRSISHDLTHGEDDDFGIGFSFHRPLTDMLDVSFSEARESILTDGGDECETMMQNIALVCFDKMEKQHRRSVIIHEKRHIFDHFITDRYCPFVEAQAYMYELGTYQGVEEDIRSFNVGCISNSSFAVEFIERIQHRRIKRYLDIMRSAQEKIEALPLSKEEKSFIFSLISTKDSSFLDRYCNNLFFAVLLLQGCFFLALFFHSGLYCL